MSVPAAVLDRRPIRVPWIDLSMSNREGFERADQSSWFCLDPADEEPLSREV